MPDYPTDASGASSPNAGMKASTQASTQASTPASMKSSALNTGDISEFPTLPALPVINDAAAQQPFARRALNKQVDPALVVALLDTLDAIPTEQLPAYDEHAADDARVSLALLIRYGFVDNLYTPFGSSEYVIAWAHMPAHVDPRESIPHWLEMRRRWQAAGERVRAEVMRDLYSEMSDLSDHEGNLSAWGGLPDD